MPFSADSAKKFLLEWCGLTISAIGEAVAPSVCLHCGGFAHRGWSCQPCFDDCRIWDDTWCKACGMPADQGHARFCRNIAEIRPHKSGKKSPLNECRAAGAYDKILRDACLMAKTADGSWISRSLAQEWWMRHGEWAMSLGQCLLVPIPRHWTRRWFEGHDPAVSFASALRSIWSASAGADPVRLAPILRRSRATPRLSGLDPFERAKAVDRLFAVRHPRSGRLRDDVRIVLVDDICTTGSTALAAASAFVNSGLRKPDLVVIARTLEFAG